jgi:hypothetical protein
VEKINWIFLTFKKLLDFVGVVANIKHVISLANITGTDRRFTFPTGEIGEQFALGKISFKF